MSQLGETNKLGRRGTGRYTILHSIILLFIIIQLSMDRRLWTPSVMFYSMQEDEHIVRLVAKFGTKKWPLIS